MIKFSSTMTIQYDTMFSPYEAKNWREALDWLKASGFDGAEVCISHYRGLDIQNFKQELDQRGLVCSNISTGQARTLEDISLLHEGEAMRKAQRRLMEHIDAAKILNCKVTLGLLRGLGTPGNEEPERAMIARNLEPVIQYAEDQKVKIILEAINRYETTLFTSAETTMSFIEKELGGAGCMGVHWDLFHANIEDADFSEAIYRMGDRLMHVHLADSNRWFPGYGHIDFVEVFRKLKEINFDSFASFECFNLPSKDTVIRQAGPFIEKMRIL